MNTEQKQEVQSTKKQAVSKSYTLKSFTENIKKIKEFKWLNETEHKQLEEIVKKSKQKYMDEQF